MKLLTLKCTLSLGFYLAFASEDAAPEPVKNEEVTVDYVIATNSGMMRGRALPQSRLGDDRNGVLETRLWPSISDKMEGQHRAFLFLEGASLQFQHF